ncbi:hypothetical protein ABZ897_43250 [Nonomuraea sp. NPDC046802]|uniref:hypothetical protein n=1 Tax=Nonomuraea sp. NPDC046802 TaxID=3154919 RepID=UPI0033D223EC
MEIDNKSALWRNFEISPGISTKKGLNSRQIGTLGVRVEVWPLIGDQGIWLISGPGAWRTGDIDCAPQHAAHRVLTDHGVADLVRLLHSTSWRAIDGAVVLTYIAVLDHVLDHPREPLLSRWPASLAITHTWAAAVGKPAPHPPVEAPTPRDADVLLHALRHLRFLAVTDTAAHRAMSEQWKSWLEPFTATLSGLYQTSDEPAPADPRGSQPPRPPTEIPLGTHASATNLVDTETVQPHNDDAAVATERAWLVQAVAPLYDLERERRGDRVRRFEPPRPAFEGLHRGNRARPRPVPAPAPGQVAQ